MVFNEITMIRLSLDQIRNATTALREIDGLDLCFSDREEVDLDRALELMDTLQSRQLEALGVLERRALQAMQTSPEQTTNLVLVKSRE